MSIINAEMGSSSTPSNAGIPRGGTAKRAFDIVAASAMLVFALPAMFFIAVFLFSTDRGPIVFSHERVGHNGRRFRCLKFRSMVADAEQMLADVVGGEPGVYYKPKEDPRVTPVGRFIRRYSLDELPQILNVLKGDMSLVGPRPQIPAEVALYNDLAHRRLLVKPGMTGLWQVSGRSALSAEEAIRLDAYYAENWSLGGDLMIMLRTLRAVIGTEGAY